MNRDVDLTRIVTVGAIGTLGLVATLMALLHSTQPRPSEPRYSHFNADGYPCTVLSVHDGDTITVDISIGLEVHLVDQVVRLDGINAPEVTGSERPQGIKSRDWLREKLPEGSHCTIRLAERERDKYGRWLAVVTDDDGINLNQSMVSNGLAKSYVLKGAQE